MQVTKFEAEKVGEEIILSMEVTDGEKVWPGRKCVPSDADLKVEADILAAEIIDAHKPVEPVAEVKAEAVDVSKVVVEVKTLEEAMAAKPKPVKEEVIEAPVGEVIAEEAV